ncbi:MAG: Mrp/NBP35 family ATP-binding protein [Desulfovibrionaceae bacterium]|nr:Mrp/NBP35 family ATP-binding protein [Desulfovibrionaceae bacterium]
MQSGIPETKAMARKKTMANLHDVRHILFVMSGKGGVGKSTVTVNLAAALAQKGQKTGILDVDLHGPSIPGMLGISDRITGDDQGRMIPASCAENLSCLSVNMLLSDPDSAIIWRGPKKNSAIRQFLTETKWGALDYLVIDSPPGTGDEHLAVLDMIPDASCIMVTTPQEIALADVRKALHFVSRMEADLLGLVENMSGFICPHCGEEVQIFGSGGGEKLAQQFSIPFLSKIPIDISVERSGENGRPLVWDKTGKDSAAGKAFLDLADKIILMTESAH